MHHFIHKGFVFMGFWSFFLGGNLRGAELQVGDSAPVLDSIDQDGNPVLLGDVYDKGLTLVYFYPKADTPGCTAQACSLRDGFEEISHKGVTVIGVSGDTPEAQRKFKDKYNLPFTLLADTDGSVAKAFGVPTFFGAPSRQAFLIRDGKILWLDRKASTKKQAADVLKVLGQLTPP